ncbi:MAG: 4'-phosphopantetheinyl transferase superfamily protein, partial [Clostridia bacterium]|nr:4'-phosphopantetheinyl transferase superfamily protein [Clostridia bacterium]
RWPAGINGSRRIALIPARPAEIGCDVEPYENRLGENAKRKVAKRYFSDKENDLIGTYDDFNRAFTRMWTAKESYVKCTGEGLGGLSKTDVTSPGENYEIFSYDIKKGRKAYSVSVCIRK